MQQLNPAETFVINRILENHTDSTTYYVRAVVYDATTRAVLATKDLTDNGDRWFSAEYKVPYDNAFSNGRRIVIITSVYTDSGYTTKSPNHGDDSEEYLVQMRYNHATNFGGGSSNIDEKALVKSITEAMTEQLKPLVEMEPVDFSELQIDPVALVSEIMEKTEECVGRHVSSIEKPEPVDFSPVIDRLTALAQAIIERPKFKETDHAQVLSAIADAKSFMEGMRNDTVRVLEEIIASLMKENEQLRSLTNGAGGTIQLMPADDKKKRILDRLARKYNVATV